MWKPLEMHAASRMRNIVQIRKTNAYFVTTYFFLFCKSVFGALGVESPHGGAIGVEQALRRIQGEASRTCQAVPASSDGQETSTRLIVVTRPTALVQQPRASRIVSRPYGWSDPLRYD